MRTMRLKARQWICCVRLSMAQCPFTSVQSHFALNTHRHQHTQSHLRLTCSQKETKLPADFSFSLPALLLGCEHLQTEHVQAFRVCAYVRLCDWSNLSEFKAWSEVVTAVNTELWYVLKTTKTLTIECSLCCWEQETHLKTTSQT